MILSGKMIGAFLSYYSKVMKSLFASVALAMSFFAHAELVTKTVDYSYNGKALEGYVAYDSSWKGTRPVVVIVHDWDGITDHERTQAKKLAKLGYVAFCADIYGKDVRPKTSAENAAAAGTFYKDPELFHNRLMSAYKTATGQPKADETKMAAIGYCFGGTGVLEMAREGMPLKGVVSFHGGLNSLSKGDSKPAARILVLHGDADKMVNPQVDPFIKEMKTRGADFRIVPYPGADHAFSVEGSGRYQKAAADKSWEDMKLFLTELFK